MAMVLVIALELVLALALAFGEGKTSVAMSEKSCLIGLCHLVVVSRLVMSYLGTVCPFQHGEQKDQSQTKAITNSLIHKNTGNITDGRIKETLNRQVAKEGLVVLLWVSTRWAKHSRLPR